MLIDSHDYKSMTDYLERMYQCELFARAGIEHPVTVYYPSEEQTRDVDSILDLTPPRPEARDFAAYDKRYLQDLLNSKRHLRNGYTFSMKSLGLNPLTLRGSIGRYFDMLATCAALEHELRAAVAEGWMRAPTRATYHRQEDPQAALLWGWRRSAGIGIGCLTVFNDDGIYKAILARRSQKTAYDSGLYHVLPAMMFGPSTAELAHPQEWSVRHQVHARGIGRTLRYARRVGAVRVGLLL